MTAPFCGPINRNFYLGRPDATMVQLTIPDSGYAVTLDQARVDHVTLGGYHAVQRAASFKRTYGLSFSALGVDSADQIMSILYGLLGAGPYWFIDPAWRNVQSSHVSSCGKNTQTATGFVASGGGAVAYSTAVTPPPQAPLVGVQAWSGAGAASTLWLGATAAQTHERAAVPATGVLPQTFAVWLRSASGTPNVAIDAYFNDANGAFLSSVSLAATNALSTTWKRFAANLPAASIPAAAATVNYALRTTVAATPTVYVSANDVQFVTASVGTATTSLPPWVLGLACPRVLLSGTAPANATGVWWRRNHALTLVQAA